ncbi:hypothetical protein DL98DRAFT_595994 [Cadophora sp. DSE1049]|nr:hypothetical protein DL98DRAFT_595994 [Cadophora sp. DSE1049]
MVLDPLTAFSVAGTVIQFVDFGLKLFQRSEELYRSVRGALSVNEELDQTIYQILKLVEKLLQSLGPDGALGCQTNDEYTLAGLCDACKAVAREMISRLNDLKVKGRARAWKSLRAAIMHAWNQDAMMALQKKLEGIKALIESYVLVSVRENVVNLSIETSERFTALDSRSQLIIDSLLERRKEFSEELRDQTLAIAQLLSRSEIAILDHLEESKARILGTVQEAQRITSLNGIANDQLLRSKNAEALCRDMTEKSLLEGL